MNGGLAEALADGKGLRQSQVPVFVGVLIVHAAVGWALLSVPAVRKTVMESLPVMIATMIEADTQPERYVPPPPANPELRLAPQPIISVVQVPMEALVHDAPAEAAPAPPAEFTANTHEAPTSARIPAPSPPKTIPASAVEYVVMPKPLYPLYSRRARETGTVVLRVLINEQGLPVHIEIEKSSGHSHLDEAALAAMQGARFKPYTENGIALAVWAPAPIVFEL